MGGFITNLRAPQHSRVENASFDQIVKSVTLAAMCVSGIVVSERVSLLSPMLDFSQDESQSH